MKIPFDIEEQTSSSSLEFVDDQQKDLFGKETMVLNLILVQSRIKLN